MSDRSLINIIFDGPPSSPNGPRFIEVEDAEGDSIRVGEWMEYGNGLWCLQITREDIPEIHVHVGPK